MNRVSLIVEVFDSDRNVRHTFSFARTPVRVGRSPLNDLPLDRSFVSHCHGVLHSDGNEVVFVDLGSTNGSFVGGVRLGKNSLTKLKEGASLQIGSLELHVRLTRDSGPETQASYAFQQSRLDLPRSVAPAANAGPQAPNPFEAAIDVSRLALKLEPIYQRYRASFNELLCVLKEVAPDGRVDGLGDGLLKRFPELAYEAKFQRWQGASPGSPAAGSESKLGALLGLPEPARDDARFTERVAALVERFAQAFIELRRGQRQFVKESAVSLAASDPAGPLDNAQALLTYLLDPQTDGSRLDELSRAYADIMLHQVALLNGFSAGAREVLETLSPTELARERRGLSRFVLSLFGRDPRLRLLRQRYEDLQEETALSRVLLGRAFARAYAGAMGRIGREDAARSNDTGRL